MSQRRHRTPHHGGSAPATPGFNAVAPEWLSGCGAAKTTAPAIPAAESTLGSHPCVALSSAQVLPEWLTVTSSCNAFAVNGDYPLNFVSHSRGSVQFAATNVTLEDVLLVAYNTTRIQIQGGPNWIDSERFDIEAVGTAKRGQMLPMIQNLLADRFSLAVHRETKDVPAYVLVIGKSGHKLRPAKEGGITRHMPDPRGPVTFERMPMSGFAKFLSSAVVQPVIDRTGLDGFFDFTLDLTPDPSQFRPAGGDASPFPPDVYNARVDLIRSAVQEQLGLGLQMQRAPIEVIMIDRVQRPTEN